MIKRQIRSVDASPDNVDALRYQREQLMQQRHALGLGSPQEEIKNKITFAYACTICDELNEASFRPDFSRSYKLYDRDVQLKRVANEVVAVNFTNRGTDFPHALAVVPGGSGIGKTRFGWEVAQLMVKPRFCSWIKKCLNCEPDSIVTEYVYIDFKKSESFTKRFDSKVTAQVALGVRLAAQGLLRKSFKQIVSKAEFTIHMFTARTVLHHIVTRILNSKPKDKILQIVLHLDEFQFFVDSFPTPKAGCDALKAMLMEMREFMFNGMKESEYAKRFFIVPVLTGTAAYDLSFLTTHRITPVTISLLPLIQQSSLSMFKTIYLKKFSEDLIDEISRSSFFLIPLADTGYVPNYLAQFFREDIDLGLRPPWGELVSKNLKVRKDKKLFGGPTSTMVVIKLALAGQPVVSTFRLPSGKTIGQLERAGDLFLQRTSDSVNYDSKDGRFYVSLPFVQLVAAQDMLLKENLTQVFPPDLLFYPSPTRRWTWQQFEELHGHFHALKMTSLRDLLGSQTEQAMSALKDLKSMHTKAINTFDEESASELSAKITACEKRLKIHLKKAKDGFKLEEIFCGALGDPTTLSRCVLLMQNFKCYHEKHQWVPKDPDKTPDVSSSVQCEERDGVSLFEGVFLCCAGNPIFDGRFCCVTPGHDDKPGKNVLVVWQDKHSVLKQSRKPTCVRAEDICAWHTKAQKVLHKWNESDWEVVYFFLTNRKLTNSAAYGIPPKGLLVVTREQLSRYLGPTLAGRGLFEYLV